jgi:hypothetical protein
MKMLIALALAAYVFGANAAPWLGAELTLTEMARSLRFWAILSLHLMAVGVAYAPFLVMYENARKVRAAVDVGRRTSTNG